MFKIWLLVINLVIIFLNVLVGIGLLIVLKDNL